MLEAVGLSAYHVIPKTNGRCCMSFGAEMEAVWGKITGIWLSIRLKEGGTARDNEKDEGTRATQETRDER